MNMVVTIFKFFPMDYDRTWMPHLWDSTSPPNREIELNNDWWKTKLYASGHPREVIDR